jgi:hypothetical protein
MNMLINNLYNLKNFNKLYLYLRIKEIKRESLSQLFMSLEKNDIATDSD